MKYCLPGELWNQIEVPVKDTTLTIVSTYLSEMAYKLSSITDVMMTKEFWHTVCEFAERCGSLLERYSSSINHNALSLTVTTPTSGSFQRFIGAGVNNAGVGISSISASESASGYVMTFDSSLTPTDGSNVTAYVDYSVVPDINAIPINQKVPLWFLKKYDRLLISGTLMRIYAMRGESWMDENAARMHATTYLHEVDRVSHGLITSGMRKMILVDAESVLARQATTTNSTTQTNTVG